MFRIRLKELREKAGYKSQQAFANAFGVAQSTVAGWESGSREPNFETAARLSAFLGTSLDYLFGLNDIHPSFQTEPAPLRIPVLGSVPAGIPLEAISDIIDWEELPAAMGSGGKEYFALEVKGDSMYPDFLPGDRVIVRKTPVCTSGDVCIVYVNGYDATLKQIRIGSDHSLTLVPRNPQYPPRTYSPDEIDNLPVSIAGVVVELRRKVN